MGNKLPRHELIAGIWDHDLNQYPNDKYTFTSQDGYECEIKRNHDWVWCGYIILPNSHSFYYKI